MFSRTLQNKEGGIEFISASTSQEKTMLNAKDDDRGLPLGKYWEKCIGECGILDASRGPTEAKSILSAIFRIVV